MADKHQLIAIRRC